jgi:hypothetical protein
VETADYVAGIGSQPEYASPLDRALQIATTDMAEWLVNEYMLEPWAAQLLIGHQGKYHIVTVAGWFRGVPDPEKIASILALASGAIFTTWAGHATVRDSGCTRSSYSSTRTLSSSSSRPHDFYDQ